MKYTKQLPHLATFTLVILSLFILLPSCKKDAAGSSENIPIVTTPASFSLLKVDYFMAGTDHMDSTMHQLSSYQLQNASGNLITKTYIEDFVGLNKKSVFTLQTGSSALPKELNLSTITLPTPNEIQANQIYAADLGWQLSTIVQQKPDQNFSPISQSLNIPARKLIQVDRSINEYWADVSFTAKLKNQSTGEIYTLNGKWKGTLRFSNYSVVLTEKPL